MSIDTPAAGEELRQAIERVGAYFDRRCTADYDCPVPHSSWDLVSAALLAAHRERDQAEESRVTNAKLLDRALQDLAAARQEVEALRNALEEVEESLNHPDLAGANARCDAIALTVAAALAATPEEKNDAP